MPLVQLLKYREMENKRGQEILAEMSKILTEHPAEQGGWGRLHLEGKTIGDNPFDPKLRKVFQKWGYQLDSYNWIYWKKYPTDDVALQEMERLSRYREKLSRSWFKSRRARVENLQVRVMQDPVLDEGWGEVNTF